MNRRETLKALAVVPIIMAIFCVVGCRPEPHTPKSEAVSPPPESKYLENHEHFEKFLPPGAEIIEKMPYQSNFGYVSTYYIIQLNIENKPKKFLFRIWIGSHGEIGTAFTQIHDEQPRP